ncbi:TIGR04086 family membrane protein [Desertibacillus haloalkaliphilus]|nr:TIGR04086 family membrane protein [Desertibacillus haloalkaliphilus]
MLYGVLTILAIALSFSFIVSLVLTFTAFTESSFSWLILTASFLALFIGGVVSGMISKQKGWVVGAATALLYSVITFLIQYLGYNSTFSLEQYVHHAGYLACGVLGGIIGVNLFSNQS